MKREHITLSQTLIKKIVDKHHEKIAFCPLQIYEINIHKRHNDFKTWPMMLGLYGETLCIGSGARETVLDLPPDGRSGKKRISQIMVEQQATLFPYIAMEYQIAVHVGINTQVELYYPYDDLHTIRGVTDIFPSPIYWNGSHELAIIDVKFTKSIHTTYGDYSWGTPEYIDHLQGDLYMFLARNINKEYHKSVNPEKSDIYDTIFNDFVLRNKENIKFIYWIMGYITTDKPREQVLFIERAFRDAHGGNLRQMDMLQRIKLAIKYLREAEDMSWKAIPNPVACKKCPLARHNGGDCKLSVEQNV